MDKKPRGRPLGYSPGRKYTALRQVMLSESQSAALKTRAKAEGTTVSKVIRRAIDQYLGAS